MAKVYIEASYNIKGTFNIPDRFINSKHFDEWLFNRISENQLTERYSEDINEEFQLEGLDRRAAGVV